MTVLDNDHPCFMRVNGLDEVPLDHIVTDAGPVAVTVPGFGHLLVMIADGEPRAMLAHGPGRGPVPKDATLVDGRIEVDMLHKADRLTVCVPTAVLGG